MKYLIVFFIFFVLSLCIVFSYHKSTHSFIVDNGTYMSCLEGALRARVGFRGTDFARWNFYESCVLNIACSNPMRECPVKEIHEQSQFFLSIDQ